MRFSLMPISCLFEAKCVLFAAVPKASSAEEALDSFLGDMPASEASRLGNLMALDKEKAFAVYAGHGNRQVSIILLLHYPEAWQ